MSASFVPSWRSAWEPKLAHPQTYFALRIRHLETTQENFFQPEENWISNGEQKTDSGCFFSLDSRRLPR